MEMGFVALKAEKGFVLLEQVIGNSAMGIMAAHAVFGNRCMFKYEGTALAGMAFETEIVESFICLEIVDKGTMMGMAAAAFHLSFPDRVVGGIVRLNLNIRMAGITESRLLFFQRLCCMNLVTGGTGHFAGCMVTEIPIR